MPDLTVTAASESGPRAFAMAGLKPSDVRMLSLYDAYEKMDASLVEINPFLLTKDNRLIALDAKVNFDDNALYRHKDYDDLRDRPAIA